MRPSEPPSTTVMKAGRKRRADGRVKSGADVSLSFRNSLYSEKAAAMIESKNDPVTVSSPSSASSQDDLAAGAFQFVDQSASSRREARRFVMRRSVWNRKQEQTKRLQTRVRSAVSSKQSNWNTETASNASSPSSPASEPIQPRLTIDTQSKFVLPYDPVRSCSASPDVIATPSPSSSPRTVASAAPRQDAFGSPPVRSHDWELTAFYHEKMRCLPSIAALEPKYPQQETMPRFLPAIRDWSFSSPISPAKHQGNPILC